LLSWAVGGCAYVTSLHNRALWDFADGYQCPVGRVSVVQRPYAVVPPQPRPPPDDVARDPERLKIWNDQVAAAQNNQKRPTLFEVTGCDHDGLYLCEWDQQLLKASNGDATLGDAPACLRGSWLNGFGVYFVPFTLKVDDQTPPWPTPLLRGDVITEVDHKSVANLDDVNRVLATSNGTVVVKVLRNGAPLEVTIAGASPRPLQYGW
jgi:hypothetical protein